MNLRRSAFASLGLSLALITAAGLLQAQQATTPPQQNVNRGSITGIVKDATTGAPLGSVNVVIDGTALGSVTSSEGRYTIANVQAGIVTLKASRIGYSATTISDMRVTAGAATTKDIALSVQALILSGVVSTGLTDPGSGTRNPFSVASVGPEKLEVASFNNPLEVLAGKVASLQIRGGNSPGSDVNIQIRNPLSITGFTQPLIIIDGVIQMQDDPTIGARAISGNPFDLNGANIESIEVVRGAAAAALYGQQAANGVINITTKKGSDLALGTTRLALGNEAGLAQLGKKLPISTHHQYLVNEDNQFVDNAGRVIPILRQTSFVVDPNRFVDNEWGVPIYDNVSALYKIGYSLRNSFNLSQNSLATNFNISATVQQESGVVRSAGGSSSQNVGVNLDYRAGSSLSAGMGVSYNRAYTANLALNPEGAGNANPFLNASNICKCVNIKAIDPLTGDYIPHPDGSGGAETGSLSDAANPLYFEAHRDEWDRRAGLQVNGNATFRPSSVLSINTQGGYNRADREEQLSFLKKGDLLENGQTSVGEFDLAQSLDEQYNGRARVGILAGLGGWTVRANVSTGGTLQKRNSISVTGDTLLQNQPDYNYIRRVQVGSVVRDTRQIDYSANLALDYNQKYIVDMVYRTDGSSLLPPDTRWNANGRASAAWALSEEPWWPFADFTLFKPRYSIGTAGNNPSFQARYELYNQNTGTGVTRVSKSNLGNDEILPEEVTEQEFGVDMTFRNRYSLSLTYVRNTVKNQIRPDTILAYTGFDTQQANLGDLQGDTYEATFEAQWIQTRTLRWSSTLVLDRSRQKITSYPRLCDRSVGNSNSTTSTYQRYCEGFVFGQIFGRYHLTDKSQLAPVHQAANFVNSTGATVTGSGAADTHFQVNDEGWLVAVGPGGSWTDMRWGQEFIIDGIEYEWGLPIYGTVYDADGLPDGTASRIIGNGLPDFSFGFGNQLSLGRWTVSVQTLGQVGGHIFNQAKVRSMNRLNHAVLDQVGKPDYLKKTIDYYIQAETCCDPDEGNYGGLTSNETTAFESWIESGTFLKLNELRIAYRMDQGLPILRKLGMTGGSIAFATRDLFTITRYSGYDPQVSNPGNTTGRVDRAVSPNTRSMTVQLRLNF